MAPPETNWVAGGGGGEGAGRAAGFGGIGAGPAIGEDVGEGFEGELLRGLALAGEVVDLEAAECVDVMLDVGAAEEGEEGGEGEAEGLGGVGWVVAG